ncbi:unnamed protein product [Prorocentrum cordatum]|uniref:Uncharacterized protein n=1 Tax=Prorocentrum cordatum TaxID=2364126 RepID=A0ABN9SVP2_9DINO|nr:unnamed protein product [Polarella glacialis]
MLLDPAIARWRGCCLRLHRAAASCLRICGVALMWPQAIEMKFTDQGHCPRSPLAVKEASNAACVYSRCQMCKMRLSVRDKAPEEKAVAEAKKFAKQVKKEVGLQMKMEDQERIAAYSGGPGGSWRAQRAPRDPPPPRAPGPRSLAAGATSKSSGAASGMAQEEAALLLHQRGGHLEPSLIPQGLPPTAFKSPPAGLERRGGAPKKPPPPLPAVQMRAMLDQMNQMAERLASAQENLMAVAAAVAPAPLLNEDIMRTLWHSGRRTRPRRPSTTRAARSRSEHLDVFRRLARDSSKEGGSWGRSIRRLSALALLCLARGRRLPAPLFLGGPAGEGSARVNPCCAMPSGAPFRIPP